MQSHHITQDDSRKRVYDDTRGRRAVRLDGAPEYGGRAEQVNEKCLLGQRFRRAVDLRPGAG